MIKTFDGVRYRMRWQHPKAKILELYADFVLKYKSNLTIHQWMVTRGVVHSQVRITQGIRQ